MKERHTAAVIVLKYNFSRVLSTYMSVTFIVLSNFQNTTFIVLSCTISSTLFSEIKSIDLGTE